MELHSGNLKEWKRKGTIYGFDFVVIVEDRFRDFIFPVYVRKGGLKKTFDRFHNKHNHVVVGIYRL